MVRRLKSFLKRCKVSKWRDQLRTLVGQIEQYSAVVQRARKDLSVGPMAVTDFEPLLTAGSPCAQERLRRLITSGRKEVGVTLSDASAVSRIAADSRPAAGAKDLFASSFDSVQQSAMRANKSRSKKAAVDSNADDSVDDDDAQIDEDDRVDGSQRLEDARNGSRRSASASKRSSKKIAAVQVQDAVVMMQDDTVEELDWEEEDD